MVFFKVFSMLNFRLPLNKLNFIGIFCMCLFSRMRLMKCLDSLAFGVIQSSIRLCFEGRLSETWARLICLRLIP